MKFRVTYVIVLTASIIVFLSMAISAKILKISLTEMVYFSKLIIIGRAVTIDESASGMPPYKGTATVEIEEIIRGSYVEKHLDISYSPNLTPSAHFTIGKRCIFFIMNTNEVNYIVQAYAGIIPIQDNIVRVFYISGEKEYQTLEDFISRIKAIK